MPSVADTYHQLRRDSTRLHFSPELEVAHEALFRSGATEDAIRSVINTWLGQHQPCLFGKIAARGNQIRYCVLTESLLTRSDEDIGNTIQRARQDWWTDTFDGVASAFVIVAVSERLTEARADERLGAFAQKLCERYLQRSVPFDTVCTDSIYLEKPGRLRRTWKWPVEVNFFGCQGDQRWWQDHRIPGGIAFSMNSVGHMAKAGAINRAMADLDHDLGEPGEEWASSTVDSLNKALVLAMRTIKRASEGPLPGTRLFENSEEKPYSPCPVSLPPDLQGRNHCSYFGNYHTDHTLPSAYFRDNEHDPSADVGHFRDLDFRYLYDKTLDDYRTIGEGLRIRSDRTSEGIAEELSLKRERVTPADVALADESCLHEALERRARSQGS